MRDWVERKIAWSTMLLAVLAPSAYAQLMNRAEPLPGVTTAGQPNEADLAELARNGFVTVIDLRAPEENRGFDEEKTVEGLGMSYVSLPIRGPDTINYENAAALDRILSEAKGPVLLHCTTSNRVGAIVALRQRLIGADAATALAKGLEAGLSSPGARQVVETLLNER